MNGPALVLSSWWPRERTPHAFPFIVDHARAARTAFGEVECWSVEPGGRAQHDRPIAGDLPIVPRRLPLPWRATLGRHGARALFEAGRMAGRRLQTRPEVIIAHCLEHAGPYAAGLASAAGAPLLYVEHWSSVARGDLTGGQRAGLQYVLTNSAVVFATGDFLARAVERAGDLAPGTVRRIQNPVDTATFIPAAPVPKPETVIAQVADFRPVKGHDLLVEAIVHARDHLERANVRFVLVGDGPERVRIEGRLDAAGVRHLVRFTGKLSRAEVAEVVRQADWTLLTSESENLPCAAIESLAVGRPVAAPRVGGLPEIVGPGDGVLFDRTVDGLVTTLHRVASGTVTGLRPWQERAHAAAERYSAEAVARTYELALETAAP